FGVVFVIVIVGALALYTQYAPQFKKVPNTVAQGFKTDRINILLIGVGGPTHPGEGKDLADAIMVLSLKPSTRQAALISIPRDLWVPISFDGKTSIYNKANTAYAFARDSSLYKDRLPRYAGKQGAGTLSSDTLARLLGVPISYYLALDFEGFRQAINIVGGIDIDVPDGFTAQYPANDDPSIDPDWMYVKFTKGMQHMNGERAIEYARAREVIDNYSEGSDFARSRRQRLIIEAFKTRLFQPEGLLHIPQLLGVAAGHVDTNYSVPSAAQLAQLAADWRNVRFYQAALTNQNYLVSATGPQGTYILVPDTQGNSWADIQALCKRLWKDPETGTAMANTQIVVENDTGVAGVATKLGAVLSRMGYQIGTPTSGAVRRGSRVLDGTGGDSAALVKQLESDLKFSPAEASEDTGKAVITIQLGSDDIALADIKVAVDTTAPTSAYGIAAAGSWEPAEAEPAEAQPAPAPTIASKTSTARRTATPTPTPLGGSGHAVPTPTAPLATSGPAAVLPSPTPVHATATPRPATAATATPVPTVSR
ncbi:MAG TPA: LCP family protein, partial [Chloroflexota bacterium]